MAYYAFLNDDNIVTQVIAGQEEEKNGIDWEQYYSNIWKMKCKRTSYNTRLGKHFDENGIQDDGIPFRKNFAGIGFKYDAERDAFIPPQPFASWVLNEETCDWEPPYPAPDDGIYTWQEPEGWVKQSTTEISGA